MQIEVFCFKIEALKASIFKNQTIKALFFRISCVHNQTLAFLELSFENKHTPPNEAKRSTKSGGLRLYPKPPLENNFLTQAPAAGRVESLHNFQMLALFA